MAQTPRKGSPDPTLEPAEFRRRFLAQFQDPAFEPLSAELERIATVALDAYSDGRKSPRTQKAGAGFHDPDYDLATDWIRAREAIAAAEAAHDDPAGPARFLLISGAARNEHTCPGELSKSWRLIEIARETIGKSDGVEIELLDLSRLNSEYGRHIHPCKTCFSTSPALCHWPCSCYPNYALGQTQDWMNEIYPMWVRAHGVMIVTPVNWYQASSPTKLMMDRLVCADGGNRDPSLTHGKDAAVAQEIERAGWNYPKHLAGRQFAVVVHGDAEGAGTVRRCLTDWLSDMELKPAGALATLDRYVGYWGPYADSHSALDADTDFQGEVANAAASLLEAVLAGRAGEVPTFGADLKPPRQK